MEEEAGHITVVEHLWPLVWLVPTLSFKKKKTKKNSTNWRRKPEVSIIMEESHESLKLHKVEKKVGISKSSFDL